MIKRMSIVLLSMLLVLGIIGCSSESKDVTDSEEVDAVEVDEDKDQKELEEDPIETEEDSEPEEPQEKQDDSIGKTEESDLGLRTIVKSKKDLNIVKESGPFIVSVTDIQASHFEPAESYKDMFNGKDELTIITMAVSVENTSTDTNSIYPDQGTITTNTKEQANAHLFLSDSVGGDFIGEIIKSGEVIFLLDSPAKDINNIKYIVDGGIDDDYESLGEDITFEIDLD